MSRQNFYARRRQRQRRQIDGELVVQLVRQERQIQPRLGARKLRHVLRETLKAAGVALGRDRFFGLLRQEGLLVGPLPREWVSTTCSRHDLPVYANLLKDLEVSGPNQAWVSDLTYVRTEEGFLILALVTDKSSRKIVGYHCAENLEASGCVRALEMALSKLPSNARPIHHSDRGTQYCSHAYVGKLAARGLPISMTEKNHCAENALAERMNGILKSEYGLGGRFANKDQARRAIDQGVWLYNQRRPHSALNFRTPAEAHCVTEKSFLEKNGRSQSDK
jgi:transposase InsO family protein